MTSESLPLGSVLKKYSQGPQSGVFTDGGARPNPGPGGWGFVHVVDGTILGEKNGHEQDTTNNRMELRALIEAYQYLPHIAEVTIYSDSNLCVQTINTWAASWARNGWKRKSGPIANLDLVKVLYDESLVHPNVKLEWVKAHNGWLWNEYADSLSSAWCRSSL
jgi:ribonuclease HI